MNAIIGEITTYFEENQELSEKTGEMVYSPSAGGFAVEASDAFVENGVPFRLITKIGKDMQGEMHLDLLCSEGMAEEDDMLFSSMPSSIAVDGSLMIRSTAPSSMKKKEILEKLDGVDKVYVSGLLLSFSPLREEIVGALVERKKDIKRVVVNAADPSSILMVEDLRDSLVALRDNIGECFLVGDILSVEGVKRASSILVTELFNK